MITQQTTPFYSRPGIDEVVLLANENRPVKYYSMLTQEVNVKTPAFRAGTSTGFSAADMVNEGDALNDQVIQTPFTRDYPIYVTGLAFSLTNLAMNADFYNIYRNYREMQSDAIYERLEILASTMINGAAGAAVTPDGLSLANAAHPLITGTGSNIVSGNPPLGYSALASATQLMIEMLTHTKMPVNYTGELALWCAPANRDFANRLIYGPGIAGTPNRDINFQGQQITKVISSPYFGPGFGGSNTAWGLVAMGKKNPLRYVNRQSTVFAEGPDTRRMGNVYVASNSPAFVPVDWRYFCYSAGA
jgi:hypothetical protein